MRFVRVSSLKLLQLFAASLTFIAVIFVMRVVNPPFTLRFLTQLDAGIMQRTSANRSSGVNLTRLPVYVRKWYDELGTDPNGPPRRRRYATIVVVNDIFNCSNSSIQLFPKLVNVALNDCMKNTISTTISPDNETEFQLYILIPGCSTALGSELEKALNRTLYFRNCKHSHFVKVRPLKVLSVLDINNAVLDAYLDMEGEYFRLILLSSRATIFSNGQELSAWQLADALDRKMQLTGHGILIETTDYDVQSSFSWVFLSAVHMEIFGWLLPPEINDIHLSVELLVATYEKHNLTRFISKSSSAGNGKVGEGEDGFDWIVGQRKNVSLASNSIKQQISVMKETIDRYMAARVTSSCWRCNEVRSSAAFKVVSMSLYGKSRRYTVGIVRNAHLLPITFPGWRLRIYCELPITSDAKGTKYEAVPQYVLRRLVSLGAELYAINTSAKGNAYNIAPMLWRFLVAIDQSVEAFIVRDADSRLTPRDAAVVNAWLNHPEAAFHCIRDHPSHSSYSVSGGLWGGRPKNLTFALQSAKSPLTDFIAAMRRFSAAYVDDMNFLGREIWPRVQSVAFCHDSFSCDRFAASHPFPIVRQGSEHLGEVYNEFTIGRQGDINILLGARVNKNCVP